MLTPAAVGMLTERLAELFEKHKSQFPGARLNREFQAEAMELSVRTAGKVLRAETVDRATILVAFRAVGIPWDESYCQASDACIESEDSGSILPESSPKTSRLPRLGIFAPVVAVLGIAGILGFVLLKSRPDNGDMVTKDLQAASKAYQVGDYQTAWKYVKLQEQQTIKNRRADERAWWLKLEADLLSLKGQNLQALEKYSTSFQLFQSINLDYDASGVLESIADTELRLGQLDNARTHYQQRYQWAKNRGMAPDLAAACRGLGSVSLERGDTATAIRCFQDALASIPAGQEVGMVHDIRARSALALAETGDLAKARQDLEDCLDYWTSAKHSRWMATTKLQLAAVVLKQGQTSEAQALLRESKSVYQELGDEDGVCRCEQLLGESPSTKFKVLTKYRV